MMNGPSCMYTVHPYNKFNEEIEFPTCMYRMKNLQTSIAFNGVLACPTTIASNMNSYDNKQARSILEQKPLPQIVNLEGRQKQVLAQLEQIKQQMALIKDLLKGNQQQVTCTKHEGDNIEKPLTELDVVINASPQYPPYSVIALANACSQSSRPQMACHIHSSLQNVAKELSSLFHSSDNDTKQCNKNSSITLIWKNVGRDAELILSPSNNIKIRGEVNILRFLSHLSPQLKYSSGNSSIEAITATDAILDTCHRLLWNGSVKERQSLIRTLNSNLRTSAFLAGESATIADIAAWSVLKQLGATQELTANMAKWYQKCSDIFGVK